MLLPEPPLATGKAGLEASAGLASAFGGSVEGALTGASGFLASWFTASVGRPGADGAGLTTG